MQINELKKSDFYFDLPKELIAQHHAQPRDHSRLLCLDKQSGDIRHKHFYDIVDILKPTDLLVVNNSKVIPARLIGEKEHTGAVCEILMLKEKETNIWECLARPGKRLKPGTRVVFADGLLTAEILETMPDGNKLVKFIHNRSNIFEILDEIGKMPLPPYITAQLTDNNEYQTVYAKTPGSAAAPTAGLHFTEELIEKLKSNGVKFAEVTLHVGLGTFRPVKEDNVLDHKMHSEWYSVSEETADLINETKQNGGRVICVGTTSCRTLESVYQKYKKIVPCSGNTDIFIYPGYRFGIMDGLITNFHLPESTLIMLVSAFAGYDNVMNAYKTAVNEKYRFFSFGDAMIIL